MPTENPAPFFRLFIALAVPPAVRAEIGRAQSQLQRHSPPGAIRWTRPEQFHVTLKYLGDLPPEQVVNLERALAAVCAVFPALRLSARGVGFFPSAQQPRVIWAGIEDAPGGRLAALHQQIERAVRPFAPPEKRETFAGHITLGRFKPGHHQITDTLLQRIAILQRRQFGDWSASAVEIVRSELTSEGARHMPLTVIPLAR